jgi:hypothetical protein
VDLCRRGEHCWRASLDGNRLILEGEHAYFSLSEDFAVVHIDYVLEIYLGQLAGSVNARTA